MTPELLLAAQQHANACYPRESCGVVIDFEDEATYRPCGNLSACPNDVDFDPLDLATAEDAGRLIAYVHSHPDGPVIPSERDRASCEASGLPWFIVEAPGITWTRLDPGRSYEGRSFVFGVDDCWSLVREWYMWERGWIIPDFLRSMDFWKRGETPHLDHLEAAGFRYVLPHEMRPGDGMLFHVASRTVNHCAVFLGNGVMLHHLPGRLSRIDQVDGDWLGRLDRVVRHV